MQPVVLVMVGYLLFSKSYLHSKKTLLYFEKALLHSKKASFYAGKACNVVTPGLAVPVYGRVRIPRTCFHTEIRDLLF